MKRYTYYIYIIVALLMPFVAQSAQAQQAEQDALYIFRNDGRFNAFFFGDIDHFEYSCIDTLGIEHDDYVVQEVYALDSVFRIPLSAIDSISFVTPETKYKADVIMADRSIVNYITASDSVSWIRLSSDVPSNLLPQKGDKWILRHVSPYTPDGFGGLVTAVTLSGASTTVTVEPMEPDEVYEQAVIKTAVGSQSQSEAKSRADIYRYEKFIEIPPYQGDVTLSGSKDIINTLDVGYISSASALGHYKYYFKPTIHARSFLNIGLNGVNFDSYLQINAEVEYSGKVSGTFSQRVDLPYPSIYTFFRFDDGLPDTEAYAKLLWKAGMAFEGAGTVKLESEVAGKYSVTASARYYKPLLGSGQWTADYDATPYEGNKSLLNVLGGDYTLSLSFMAEAAIQVPMPWLKTSGGCGMRAELGQKTVIDASPLYYLTASDELEQTYWRDHTYEKADKENAVMTTPYASLDVYTIGYGMQFSLAKPNIELLRVGLGFVPDIKDLDVETGLDTKYGICQGLASYRIRRALCGPAQVGLVLLDIEDHIADIYWRPTTYWNEYSDTKVERLFTFDPMVGMKSDYSIFPIVKIGDGNPVLHSSYYSIVLDSAFIELPDDFALMPEAGREESDMQTNIPKIELSTGVNWVTATFDPLEQTITLNYEGLPEDKDTRSCKLHVVGKSSKDKVLVVKDVPVQQFRAVIRASDKPIQADAGGGTYTVKITGTALEDVRLFKNDDFLHPSYKDGVLTIVVDPNTTGQERQGTITIAGNLTVGASMYGDETTVTVKQAAAPTAQASISPETLTFLRGGGTKTVKITATGYKKFGCEAPPSWLTAKIGESNTIEITASENTTDKDRKATLKCYVTNEEKPTEAQKFYLPVEVTQSAIRPSVSPDSLTFDNTGGTQTVTIKAQGYARRGFTIDNEVKSWLSAKNGENNTVNITVQANTTGKDRTATVWCYVTNVTNSTEAQRLYMPVKITQKGKSASVSPSELNFLTGGGTKSVKITATDYKKFGYDTPPSWLTVKLGEGNTIDITAGENTTGKERSGTVKCYVTNEEKPTEAQKVYLPVKVTQSATAPSVSPTKLTFRAAGESLNVTVKPQGYARRGYFIEETDKSWLSAKIGESNDIVFTATANTTGKERTATVKCFVTNYKNSADAQRIYMPVKITQKASSQIQGVSLYVQFGTDMGGIEQDMGRFGGSWGNDNNNTEIVVNPENGVIHITCSRKTEALTEVLSFDIDDLNKLKSETATISNINGEGNGWGIKAKGSSGNSYKEDDNSITCRWYFDEVTSFHSIFQHSSVKNYYIDGEIVITLSK